MYDLVNAYLENGLRIVLHRIPQTRTTSCGLWVKQGSSYETDDNNGLSHLTEHLALNPHNRLNNKYQNLMEEAAAEGVIYNAATTKEYTCYYFTGLSRTLGTCLQALGCIAKENREFDLDFFENEKSVVEQEAIGFYSAFQQIKERTSSALWGNTGTGKIIMGDIQNIRNAKREQVASIMDKAYIPNNSVLVVIGDIKYAELLNQIEDIFSDWETKKLLIHEQAVESTPGVYINKGQGVSAVLSLGFRTTGYSDYNRPSIEMAVRLLGQSGLHARMIEEIRMKRGLSYNLGGFDSFYSKRGTIGFMAVSEKKNIVEIAKIMTAVLNEANEKGFSEYEIENEKKAMETMLLLSVDNITDHLRCIGKCAVMDKDFYIENEVRAIRDITNEMVNETSRKVFNMDNLGLACIGEVDVDELVENVQITSLVS
ncbi:M16 family metallopeptidase [Pseudobutyrivibrio xylanivorans]|uniref:Insulinase family protein n=1 Tax=Pseudobutyrivibrio xylanivorans TaxID=185007 RepID=A0A5P6VQB3_PSEXY|nr:pitrilysin family protein [Pseudobutyrivibrio xylanivorans]QFJ54875.1 insulinase family protein [Pseudobutyrivibrio xylanivorans]